MLSVTLFTPAAEAMYHPGLGRFLQRDPHGTQLSSAAIGAMANRTGTITGSISAGEFMPRDVLNPAFQYQDGMSLYQYVRSAPTAFVDPTGEQGNNVRTQNLPNKEKCKHCRKRWVDDPAAPPPSTNGCSAPGWLPGTPHSPGGVPRNFFFFMPACNSHDLCYADCNRSQKQCDDAFYKDLVEICDTSCKFVKPRLPGLAGGNRQAACKRQCKNWARRYVLAVRIFGSTAYYQAQDANCHCVK